MHLGSLPFFVIPSPEAERALGDHLARAATLALRAILRNRRSLEVAHQQVRYGRHALAMSSRIGPDGDLILAIDLGDPRLADRLILEEDLRRPARGHEPRPGRPGQRPRR